MGQTVSFNYNKRVEAGFIGEDPAQQALLEDLDNLQQWIEAEEKRPTGMLARIFSNKSEPPKGMYIWGGVGRGKSMMIDIFLEATNINEKQRIHFHSFMQQVHRDMHEGQKAGVPDAIKYSASKISSKVRVLALDEIQITDITDALVVGRLFEELIKSKVLVLMTSNRPPEDLYKNGLNRTLFMPFIDLVNERMSVVELKSPQDYRQNRLVGAKVYFEGPEDANSVIDDIWKNLIAGGAVQELELLVNNRTIVFTKFSSGVLRTNFTDICDKPMGPADYLAVVRGIKVLIIENIPVMTSANSDSAKRFVTLIDAAYEGKIKIVCSAAASPEKLYVDGPGAFEFVRTASRLREMTSASWSSSTGIKEQSS